MNTLASFRLGAMSVFLVFSLTACNQPNTAETAGKKIDEAAAKAGEKMGRATENIGEQGKKKEEAIDDAAITSKVKAAIFAEPNLKSLQINVTTTQGMVTLSGSVDSQAHSDRAWVIAGAVAGVKGVENRLVVKPAP